MVTDLIIPKGTKNINNGAFANFEDLKSISIPDTVMRIGDEAFHGCKNLESITIPESVTEIGYGVFNNCSLTEILVDKNNKYYSSDSRGALFNKNKTELIRYF